MRFRACVEAPDERTMTLHLEPGSYWGIKGHVFMIRGIHGNALSVRHPLQICLKRLETGNYWDLLIEGYPGILDHMERLNEMEVIAWSAK